MFAALELFEIQRRRVLHELHADLVYVELREQRIDQGAHPAEQVVGHGQGELQREETTKTREAPALEPVVEGRTGTRQRRLQHDLVDDQLGDVEHQHRQDRAHGADQHRCHRQGPAVVRQTCLNKAGT